LTCVHSPEEPLVDLIFVHGLHGGSYKTWRKKEEKNYFWPGEWLPNDSEFQNVRIHTFGYAAEWSDFKSNNATVSDFGSSLYGALISSTHLSRRHKTPIVLIGHSMGGLVIKRACLMAHRQRETEVGVESLEDDTTSLASRIKCLVFLGTPHHGSDSAELLDKVLRSGLSPMSGKEYVKDLRKESPSNESINDEFRFIADSFHLFSFFEARPTSHLGFVVPKDSARINGPRHEHTQSIDADHRGMVKFEDEDDPNYRILHDHLLKIVDALIGLGMSPLAHSPSGVVADRARRV
jgi:pimeloyl-ACP methyl ester carboxylesterase